jgi:uncharacterized protein YecA (UPF0149 family)
MFFEHADRQFKDLASMWTQRQTLDEPPGRQRVLSNRSPHIGRNDPCPCGSGLKYKKCCGKDS